MDILAAPIAFLIYAVLAAGLVGLGRALAGPSPEGVLKSNIYSSGEAPPTRAAAPGYRPFFVVALFFTIVHLGVLMLGSSQLLPLAAAYLVGLVIALLALILG